jgi:transposase
MLTQEEDVDAHALRARGWSITAIAAHLGRDRKTIRAYLAGERVAGVRARRDADPFVHGHVKILAGGQEMSSR